MMPSNDTLYTYIMKNDMICFTSNTEMLINKQNINTNTCNSKQLTVYRKSGIFQV